MGNYITRVKAEVLYEKTFRILGKYDDFLSTTNNPYDYIKVLSESLAKYLPKIIQCEDEETFLNLERNINEYERIIDNASSFEMQVSDV